MTLRDDRPQDDRPDSITQITSEDQPFAPLSEFKEAVKDRRFGPPIERLARINQNTSSVVRANVSPSLHPAMIETEHGAVLCDGQGGPGEDAYVAGRTALKALYESIANIDDVRQSMMVDRPVVGKQYAKGSQTSFERIVDPAKAQALGDAMNISSKRAGVIVEKNLAAIDHTAERLSGFIKAKTTHPRENSPQVVEEASQIRTYVASLGPTERREWVAQRIAEKDLTVTAAVLNASPWISKLDPAQAASLRAQAAKVFAPRENLQLLAVRDIRDRIVAASASYGQKYFTLVPQYRPDPSEAAMAKLRSA